MTFFYKAYTGFTLGMTAYGFSRGYRCREPSDLYSSKITSGIVNSTMYTAPGVNLFAFVKLINRLEIDYKKLDKSKHKESYRELVGECYDTI